MVRTQHAGLQSWPQSPHPLPSSRRPFRYHKGTTSEDTDKRLAAVDTFCGACRCLLADLAGASNE
eukprot:1159777-Pelagomonas_calceolata.AAC.7